MDPGVIDIDDPRAADVTELLAQHHAFANFHSPPQDVHALGVEGLVAPSVTFFSYRSGGTLLGIGAIKELGDGLAEVKSMHTAKAARGRGVAGALVDHMLAVARERGLVRVSLETGSMEAFAPAWSVYVSRGFEPCGPFHDYAPSPNSRFMTLAL